MNDQWIREIENLSADWQRALYRAATATDLDIRNIYTDVANCYEEKVEQLRLKINNSENTQH